MADVKGVNSWLTRRQEREPFISLEDAQHGSIAEFKMKISSTESTAPPPPSSVSDGSTGTGWATKGSSRKVGKPPPTWSPGQMDRKAHEKAVPAASFEHTGRGASSP